MMRHRPTPSRRHTGSCCHSTGKYKSLKSILPIAEGTAKKRPPTRNVVNHPHAKSRQRRQATPSGFRSGASWRCSFGCGSSAHAQRSRSFGRRLRKYASSSRGRSSQKGGGLRSGLPTTQRSPDLGSRKMCVPFGRHSSSRPSSEGRTSSGFGFGSLLRLRSSSRHAWTFFEASSKRVSAGFHFDFCASSLARLMYSK
eukprot:scaffold1397_cov254-Pinguiococcus_pyrenoidosus.AAC.29